MALRLRFYGLSPVLMHPTERAVCVYGEGPMPAQLLAVANEERFHAANE